MKYPLLLAASLGALGLTACNKEADPANEPTAAATLSETTPVATETTAAAASPAQAFANVAAASDAFEIEASKLAISKATSPKIKTFAEEMVKAHTASTADLKTAAAKVSPAITPVATLSAAQQSSLDALTAKSGADFDRAYAEGQVNAHRATLDALKGYSAGGDEPVLKDFATKLMPKVAAHLNMAQGL